MTINPPISMLTEPLSLLKTIKAIEAGDMTPEDSLRICLDRIKVHDGIVKAFCHLGRDETLLTDLEKADGPLKGIGFGAKDVFDSADFPTEHNSPIYQGHQPIADAALISMARKQGASLIGKTVTTEFAFFQPGTTRNPHNLDHTPGGSSSGSAAAVAAGLLHLALGTQTGGSMIRPASFCGVTGFKPSSGLLPKTGMKPFSWSLDTAGLFAAAVEDVAYAASMITGRNLRTDEICDFANPRLGIIRGHNWHDADPDYRARFEDLAKSLSMFGIKLIDIEPGKNFIAAFHAHQIIQDFEARQALCWEYQHRQDDLSPVLRQTLDFAQTLTAADYDEARVAAETASQQMDDYFEDIDAVLTLSAPGPAPFGLESTGSSIFNRIWTLFGLPCVNVTGLANEAGMPLGAQIIGPYMSDHKTLCIAHWLEGAIQRHLDR